MSEYIPVSPSLDRHAARLCDCCRTLPASVSASNLGAIKAPSLGIYGISSSPLKNQELTKPVSDPETGLKIDPNTGEVLSEGWSYPAALAERYALQAQARRAMLEAHRRDGKPGKPHAVTRCRRWLRPRSKIDPGYAEVFRHTETGRTHFGGLEVCGSAWACPICAVKIAERRAKEIRKAVEQWMASGGICLFITLTIPHTRADTLGELVQGFCDSALEQFRGGKAFQAIKGPLGYSGLIRALEVTWGEANGWHPHTHEIWFCRPEDLVREGLIASAQASREYFIENGKRLMTPTGELFKLKVKLWQKWYLACLASGFSEPSFDRGVDVQVAETEEEARSRVAEYLAKSGLELDKSAPVWGVDDELTRVHTKRGRGQRFTPWDFLRAQYDPEVSATQRARYRALFAEYVTQFKRKRSVFWSKGLKARFDLAERTDEELADEAQEPADLLARIDWEDWQKVIYRQDHRATLLLLAQGGGADAIREFLDSLPSLSRLPVDANTS